MNSKIDDLMYEAGLTAQGCWDHMDEYDRTAVLKFAELIVRECANVAANPAPGCHSSFGKIILKRFGVEE